MRLPYTFKYVTGKGETGEVVVWHESTWKAQEKAWGEIKRRVIIEGRDSVKKWSGPH